MEESIILAVEIDTKNALTQLDLLNKAIEDGKNKQDELNQQFKQGLISRDDYLKATKENTKELKANEAATKNLTTAVTAETNSVSALSAKNKDLIKQRNSISTSTEEGRKKIAELNAQIDKNNETIKANVSNLEKQKINIGNYASALDGVIPGLGNLTQGIQSGTTAAKSFIATPFGAILAAIAVALGAVYKYLEKYEPVLDIIENAVAQVTSAFDSLIQNLDLIGSIIGNVLTLNFDKAGEAANKLGKEISSAAKEGQAIVDLTREIEDSTIAFELSSSRVELQIKRLVTAAKNRTLTAKEQQDLLNQALELENGQLEKNLEIKKKQFEADVRSLIQSKKAQLDKNQAFTDAVQQNKTLQEQFEIVSESGIFSPEQLSKALASYKAIDQAEGESLAFQEKVQNQKDAIAEREQARRDKEKQETEKRNGEAKKKAELDAEIARRQAKETDEELDKIIANLDAENQARSEALYESSLKELEIKTLFEQKLTESTLDEETKRAIMSLDLDYQTKLNLLRQEEQFAQERANIQTKADDDRREKERIANQAIQRISLDTLNFITNSVNRANQKRIASYKKLYDEGKISEQQLTDLSNESQKRYRRFALAEIAINYGVGLANAIVLAQKQAKESSAFSLPLWLSVQIGTLLSTINKARAVVDSTSFVGGSSSVGGRSSVSSSNGRSGVTATQATTNPINQQFMANSNQGMTVVASWQEATTVRNRVEFKEALTSV